MDRLHRRVLRRWRSLGWEGWWGDWIDVRFELAAELAKLRGKRVLDVGCGPGVLLAEVDSTNLKVGVDGSFTRLQTARQICPEGVFIQADAERLPFRDGFFDVAVLGGIIEYIQDKRSFLTQISRLVKNEGRILATTHNLDFWAYRGHTRLLSLDELEDLFSLFPRCAIRGYNPFPSLVSILPGPVRRRVPAGWFPFLGMPSPVLAWIPGIKAIFRRLMKKESLLRRSKAFFIVAEK